jgi:hypothetical protein
MAMRACLVLVSYASVVVAFVTPAYAGGSWIAPVLDTYSPGDAATLVGYVGRGELGWVEDGPFPAWLRTQSATAICCPGGEGFPQPGTAPGDVPVGFLSVEETGQAGLLALRVSLSFVVPASLAPNAYQVVYCNVDCTTGLGDLAGGTIYVDVAPPAAIPRSWPADDPAWQLRGEAPAVPRPERVVPTPQRNGSLGTGSGLDRSETAPTPRQGQDAPTSAGHGDEALTAAVVAVVLVVLAAPVVVVAGRRGRKTTAIPPSRSEPDSMAARTANGDRLSEARRVEHENRASYAHR